MAYFVSKTAIEVPMTLIQILVLYIICYFMMSFQGNFILLVLATFALSMVSNSLAMILGCLVADGESILQLPTINCLSQWLDISVSE